MLIFIPRPHPHFTSSHLSQSLVIVVMAPEASLAKLKPQIEVGATIPSVPVKEAAPSESSPLVLTGKNVIVRPSFF